MSKDERAVVKYAVTHGHPQDVELWSCRGCVNCARLAYMSAWRRYGALLALVLASCAHSKSTSSESHIATAAQSTQVATSTEKQWHSASAQVEQHATTESVEHKNERVITTTRTWTPTNSGKVAFKEVVRDESSSGEATATTATTANMSAQASEAARTAASSSAASAAESSSNARSTAVTKTSTPWPWKLIAAGVLALGVAVWFGRKWLKLQFGRFV